MNVARAIDPALAPTFMIVGAAKSGTTALFKYLEQHPEIFMSDPKEPHYFAFDGARPTFSGPGDAQTINRFAITDLFEYQRLFEDAGSYSVRGEASVSYLYYPEVAQKVRDQLPDTKIICLLRHPVDRAYSAFNFMRTRGYEPLADFLAALDAEQQRIEDGWHHIWHYDRMGRYSDQIRRWREVFPKEQVRIFLYDDFVADPNSVVAECHEFLGVNPTILPESTPNPHVSGEPRIKIVSGWLNRPSRVRRFAKKFIPSTAAESARSSLLRKSVRRIRLDSDLRDRLTERFHPEIDELALLLNRDLTAWKRGRSDGPVASDGADQRT